MLRIAPGHRRSPAPAAPAGATSSIRPLYHHACWDCRGPITGRQRPRRHHSPSCSCAARSTSNQPERPPGLSLAVPQGPQGTAIPVDRCREEVPGKPAPFRLSEQLRRRRASSHTRTGAAHPAASRVVDVRGPEEPSPGRHLPTICWTVALALRSGPATPAHLRPPTQRSLGDWRAASCITRSPAALSARYQRR